MKHLGAMILVAFGLSACGDSGLNPFGWFSGQSEPGVEMLNDVDIAAAVRETRPRVPTVTALRVDRTPGGAIVRATGLPQQQGWHSADLIARNDGIPTDGVLTFDFRARPPEAPTRASTTQSRELVVAVPLSNTRLQGVRSIRVVSANNILTTRR